MVKAGTLAVTWLGALGLLAVLFQRRHTLAARHTP